MGGKYPVDSTEERNRYFNNGTVTRELIEKIRYDVYNFQSFKDLLTAVFNEDNSLRELIKHYKESDFKALYNHPTIQEWKEKNDGEKVLSYYANAMNITKEEARRVFPRLSKEDRDKIFVASVQQRKINIKKRTKEVKIRFKKITQSSRLGTRYKRTKPVRWTPLQIRFLENNKGVPLEEAVDRYNILFPKNPRTILSLRNKRYRLK